MPLTAPPAPPPLVWLAQPSPERVKAAAGYFGGDKPGKGVMACYVLADGRLENCRADARGGGFHFSHAVQNLAPYYRLDVKASGSPTTVVVSIDFPKLYDTPPHMISEPSPAERAAVAPPSPEEDLNLGCRVTTQGDLADCEVWAWDEAREERRPAARESVSAGLSLAAKFKSKPATLGGRPVESYTRTPLNLSGHLILHPDWVSRPSGDEFASAYPQAALVSGLGGSARMRCRVNADGTLDGCLILSEDPPGVGFGDAVRKMSGKFRMKPKTVDGQPVAGGTVTFPVVFVPPEGVRKVQRGEYGAFTVLGSVAWTQAPTPSAVAAAFPRAAHDSNVFGHAAIRCDLTRAGTLVACEDTEESPERKGFAKAALSLAPQFRTDVSRLKPKDLYGVKIAISFDFSPRALQPAAGRFVRQAQWVTGNDDPSPQPFPQAARTAGVLSGKGVVDCRVGEDGRLTACLPVSEEPPGLGFGEAAVKTASTMRANLWTLDGEAAAGQKVRLPLRFIDGAVSEKATQDTAPKSEAKGPTG